MFVQIKNKSFSQALDTSKQIGYYNLNSLNARGMYNRVTSLEQLSLAEFSGQ